MDAAGCFAGKKRAFAALAALSMGLGGCAEVPDGDANRNGPTIVSLNPCTDAILVELADPGQVLAISHYSHDGASSSIPADVARRFAATSGTVEEVAALDPDFVLASSFMAPATGQALNDLGFAKESFGIASDIAASAEQVRRIAALVGHEDRGEALVARMEGAVTNATPPPDSKAISTVLWQPGEIVAGDTALVSAMLRNSGFASHSAALGLGQADYLSLEQVLANPPELLLVAGNSRAQQHPALTQLTETRIEALDPSLLYCAGPTIIRLSERLAEIRRSMT